MAKKLYKVLSWGGGSQSSAIIQLYLDGKIDLDYIIFSDTGLEPTYIYEQVASWMQIPKVKKIVYIARSKKNMKDMLDDYINGNRKSLRMFIYTYNPITNHNGVHPKTCTGSYKISPNQILLNKLIRSEHNLSPRGKINHIKQIVYIGYSTDEKKRKLKMKNTKNITYKFPLIEQKMSFKNTIDYLKKNNRTIYRSACFMCPFRNDNIFGMGWIDILKDDKQNFIYAVKLDVDVRNCPNSDRLEYHLYFHRDRKPLWKIYEHFINKELLEECFNSDKKGISDMKIKNRKLVKFNNHQKCSDNITGGCSL